MLTDTSETQIHQVNTPDTIPLSPAAHANQVPNQFINQKVNRGDAVFSNRKIKLDYYWRLNKKTKAKEKFLKDMGLE